VVVIPNLLIQLIVLGLGILIISLLINSRQAFDSGTLKPIRLLIKWITIVGAGYFLLPIPWFFLSDLFPIASLFIASMLSVAILVVSVSTFFVKYAMYVGDQSVIAFFWALGVGIILTIPNSNLFCFPMLIVLAISMSIPLPANGIWLVSNLAGGMIYAYILSFNNSSLSSRIIILLIASLSSSMITGLAYLVLFESNPNGLNNSDRKPSPMPLLIKSLGQLILGLICWAFFPIMVPFLLTDISSFVDSSMYYILFPGIFLVGVGVAILSVRKDTWRWFGIGVIIALILDAVIIAFSSRCIDGPFMWPFPFC
jgi:hypothetical protein